MPEHFEIRESTMPTPEEVEEGGVLIKVLVMSADPYLRPACKSEAKGGPVPRPMAGFVTGRVLSSKRDGWVEGDLFGASLPFTTFQIVSAEALEKTIMWKLTDILSESDISKGIGVSQTKPLSLWSAFTFPNGLILSSAGPGNAWLHSLRWTHRRPPPPQMPRGRRKRCQST